MDIYLVKDVEYEAGGRKRVRVFFDAGKEDRGFYGWREMICCGHP